MTFREWICKGNGGAEIANAMNRHFWTGCNALDLPVREIEPRLSDLLVLRDILPIPQACSDSINHPVDAMMKAYFEGAARWIDETFGPLTDDMTILVVEGWNNLVHRHEATTRISYERTVVTPAYIRVEIYLNVVDAGGNKASGIPFRPKSLMPEGRV